MRENKQIITDVLICGAGLSGLLLAKELSQSQTVLVAEKNSNLIDNKFWVCEKDVLRDHPDLIPFIKRYYEVINFISHDDTTVSVEGNYCLFDTKRLLIHLETTINSNNSSILYSHPFYSYSSGADYIQAKIGNKIVYAKLLIDCMGYSSPIINAHSLVQIAGFYTIYGYIVDTYRYINPIGLHNLTINNKPFYFEFFPISNDSAYAVVVIPSKYIADNTDISSYFSFIVNNTEYKDLIKEVRLHHMPLSGIIPVGRMKPLHVDRIVIYGESGQNNPSASGTAFGEYLREVKTIASYLTKQIEENRFDYKSLDISNLFNDQFSHAFQRHLFSEMLRWNSFHFSGLLKFMKSIDNHILNKIVFNKIKRYDVVNKSMLTKLFFNNGSILLRPILKTIISQRY